MTPHLFLGILVALYLAAGVVITAASGRSGRVRRSSSRPGFPRSHVHETQAPYDWEEHDAS